MSIRLPSPSKSSGLQVNSGMPCARAVAAISRSIARRPRAFLLWPTAVHSHRWRDELDAVAIRVGEEASARPAPRAVASLAGERFALELTEILPERLASMRNQHSRDQANLALREALDEAVDQPEESSIRLELFDIRACYHDAVAAMGVDLCRQAAMASLRVAGWEPDAGRPPSGHQATQIAFDAVIEAERTAWRLSAWPAYYARSPRTTASPPASHWNGAPGSCEHPPSADALPLAR
jgi:hypothetical protein